VLSFAESFVWRESFSGEALSQDELDYRAATAAVKLGGTAYVATQGLKVAGQGLTRMGSRLKVRLAPKSGMSLGAQLRAKYGAQFGEYSRFRGLGLTPAQSKYLTQLYRGMGHHFVPRRHGLPSVISESPLNVMKPKGISIGRFYERHFLADSHFFAARFPRSVGGVWNGTSIGLQKPGLAGRLWYGSPGALKVTAGTGAAAAGGGALYWWLSPDEE
jgi:hypothetical protein